MLTPSGLLGLVDKTRVLPPPAKVVMVIQLPVQDAPLIWALNVPVPISVLGPPPHALLLLGLLGLLQAEANTNVITANGSRELRLTLYEPFPPKASRRMLVLRCRFRGGVVYNPTFPI